MTVVPDNDVCVNTPGGLACAFGNDDDSELSQRREEVVDLEP